MPPTKDFYKLLGVPETATADEIKKAYRKLARRYHPDVTGGDKAKEAKFKDVSEAYETVGDDKKRAEYDAMRKHPFAGGGMPGGFPGGFPGGGRGARRSATRVEVNDLNDLFNQPRSGAGGAGFYDMFSELFRGGAGGGAPEPRSRSVERGEDVHNRVEVDLPVAVLGGELAVSIEGKRLTVKVPAGIEDGQKIRVAGKGHAGVTGPGDLILEVHVRPHHAFRRKGDDLEVDVPVPLDAAVLGGKVEVQTLEGPTKLTVPPGSSSGLKLRLRGKGARKRGAAPATGTHAERGDLYAVVMVTVPKEIPARARELIEEFGRVTREQ